MTPRPSSSASPRDGFTLLEVIIATAVAAIVLLVINTTFFTALRLHNTTQDRITEDRALQRTLGTVRRDLAGIMLPSSSGVFAGALQTTLASSLTQGTYGDKIGPDLYTNTGAINGWNPFSEVQLVDYYLAPAEDGSNTKNLVRAVTRNLLPAQVTTPELQTLLTRVADASIDFYDGTAWTDAWDSAASNTMPTAIRFQLTLAGPDGKAPANSVPVTLVVPVLVATTENLDATASTGGAP
ncbi:MAG: prepilin-type N-terminal cleavage/methylation domain-containing protein [Candidatus Didemnitutus sp.]|nr:prepilin-type N-terminal cleavage/methylation domain-containing protein [Candidatus Didemnitutus sp.]